MEPNQLPGAHKATKLWNEAICLFRSGMPLKRHRKHIRVYDNCFSGGEAVIWLHRNLQENPNFGQDVTREKAAKLMSKFHKVGVFQSVASGSSDSLESFKENELYQFCSRSPLRNLKLSALVSIEPERIQKAGMEDRSTSKYTVARKKKPASLNLDFLETVKSKAEIKQLNVLEIEEIWKTVVLGRLQGLFGPSNVEDILPLHHTTGLWIMKNATLDGQQFRRSQLFPRWVLAAMKSLIDWPFQSGTASCSLQYPGFERDVFKLIRDYFKTLQLPLVTCFLYSTFINAYDFIEYLDTLYDSACFDNAVEIGLENVGCGLSSQSLESLVLKMTSDPQENVAPYQSVSSDPKSSAKSICPSSASSRSTTKNTLENTSAKECIIDDEDCVDSFYDTDFVNATRMFAASLPPNTCFETAFTSESPITRIIPRKTVESIHMSHKSRCSKSLTRNLSFATSSQQPTKNEVCSDLTSCKIQRNTSAPNIGGTRPGLDDMQSKKTEPQLSDKHSKRRNKCATASVSDGKLHHIRNKSGGYVNLAMSSSFNELSKPDGFDELLGEVFDYDAAINTLQHLIRCSTVSDDKNNTLSKEVHGGLEGRSDSSTSSLGSYHTAHSSDSTFYTASTLTSSNDQLDEDQGNWTPDIPMHNGINTLQGQQMGIEILRLLLLFIPPVNRYKLNLIFYFMRNVLENKRLVLEDGISTKILLLDTFTNCILQPEIGEEGNLKLAYRLMHFLVENHEVLFQIPSGLKEEVNSHLAQFSKQNQDEYSSFKRAPVTYCEQVYCQQFENEKLTGSQLALAELLEQIIGDKKMGSKEKKRRLKMFKETYPHIYYRKFPNNSRDGEKQPKSKGILNLTSLSRFRNLRI